MRNKIVSFFVALLPFVASTVNGENQLDIQLGNGVHSFGYDAVSDIVSSDGTIDLGSASKHWGCNLGGVFSHYFKHGIGIQSGMRLYLYRTSCVLDSTERYSASDLFNELNYIRSIHYKNWEEEQTNLLLAIPIGVAYKTALNEKWDFYAGAGVELLLPLVSRYKMKEGSVDVSGYYSDYDVEFSDMPVHNFTSYEDLSKGTFNLKLGVSGYLDAGVRYHLKKCDLSTGLYFSYGLSNMASNTENHLFDINNEYHGLLNSQVVEKAKPIAFGLKIGVTLPLDKSVLVVENF